ncbi:hypothetical protein NQZ79_g5488 [Umbelopsis isabellina]|nr:hypothetical protein NQZ79_g5488 [Umbelopsis isabellina]
MTGRTRPTHSRSLPTERQLSSISNTTNDEYDVVEDKQHPTYTPPSPPPESSQVHDSDDESVDPSLSSSASSDDVDPDALLQLMSDQGTPTLHAIGRHSPLLDDDEDDDSDIDSSNSSLELPDSAITDATSAAVSRGPTVIRVLYLGCATDNDKSNILKKLSEGLAEIFLQRPSQVFPDTTLHADPTKFKERKHNILALSTTATTEHIIDPIVDEDEPIETYEDNGLSIIEADFTRNNERRQNAASHETIYDYVIRHMDPDSSVNGSISSEQSESCTRFDGYVYPDATPDGVDLIVYFYSGLEIDEERQSEIEDEMVLLYKLRQLGIPVLPILSSLITKKSKKLDTSSYRDQQSMSSGSYVSSTRSSQRRSSPKRLNGTHRSYDQHKSSNADYNQIMMENRTYLSNTFAEYRIQCLDVLNLEIGRPSFHRRTRRSSNEDNERSKRDNSEDWETSSLMPAPWQILTVEQFASVDKRAVYEALKKSREMAVKRETVREVIKAKQRVTHPRVEPDSKAKLQKAKFKEALIRCAIGVIIPFMLLICLLQGGSTGTSHLSNSTTVGPPTIAKLTPVWQVADLLDGKHLFVVEVFDHRGKLSSLGPEGVKLKSSKLGKSDQSVHTTLMEETTFGRYSLAITSPCFQKAYSKGIHIEFETHGGIPVLNSPVTLTDQECPRPQRQAVPKSRTKGPKPSNPSAQANLHRTFRRGRWDRSSDFIVRKTQSFVAFKLISQLFGVVYNAVAFFWDEAGFHNLVQWLPSSSSTTTTTTTTTT